MRTFILFFCVLLIGCPGGLCGDNSLDTEEACDDGNTSNADGCEANCSLPACENGIVDPGEVCFSEPVFFDVDVAPQGIVVGDVNVDGRPDLMTATSSFSVSLLLNQGGNQFVREADIELGDLASSLVLGDFDGDSVPDLAVNQTELDRVEVLRGIGDGTFAPLATLATSPSPDLLITGDFNGDEVPDLATRNEDSINVFLNSGTGFSSARIFVTGVGVSGLAAGDFNGSGSLDIAVTVPSQNSLLVMLGDGLGDFVLQASQSGGDGPGALLATDFDGDNLLDFAVTRLFVGEVSILTGNGVGLFSENKALPVFGPVALAAGDINGDGFLDIAAASDFDLNSSHLGLLLGDGVGDFEALPLLPASDGNLRGIALADLNEDGALDAVLTDQSLDRVIVFFSQP